MANDKPMSASAFQTKLKEQYKEDGEVNVDERVDALVQTVQKQNKDNNPFLFSELSNWIEKQEISLNELVSTNGSVRQTELTRIIEVSKIEWEKTLQEEKGKQEKVQKDPFLEQMLESEREKDIEFSKFLSSLDLKEGLTGEDILKIAEDLSRFVELTDETQIKGIVDSIYSVEDCPENKEEADFIYDFLMAMKENPEADNYEIDVTKYSPEFLQEQISRGIIKKLIEENGKKRAVSSKNENLENVKKSLIPHSQMRTTIKKTVDKLLMEDKTLTISEFFSVTRIVGESTPILENEIISVLQSTLAQKKYDSDKRVVQFREVVRKEKERLANPTQRQTEAQKDGEISLNDVEAERDSIISGIFDIGSLDIDSFLDSEMVEYFDEKTTSIEESTAALEQEISELEADGFQETLEDAQTREEMMYEKGKADDRAESSQDDKEMQDDMAQETVETFEDKSPEAHNSRENLEAVDNYDPSQYTQDVKENPLKKFFSRIYQAVTGKRQLAIDAPKKVIEGNATNKPVDRTDNRSLVERISDAYSDWRTGLKRPGDALKSIIIGSGEPENKIQRKENISNTPNQLISNIEDNKDPFKRGVNETVMQNLAVVEQQAKKQQKAIEDGTIIPQNVKNAGVKAKTADGGPSIGE